MNDPYETKIGIISDSTPEGTRVVVPITEEWAQHFPPVRFVQYENVNGVMEATLKVRCMPVRIKGVVTSVEWMRYSEKCKLVPAEGYEPPQARNPLGRRMHFECTGTFHTLKALDEETETILRECPFTNLVWQCDCAATKKDTFSLHLTCVVPPRS